MRMGGESPDAILKEIKGYKNFIYITIATI